MSSPFVITAISEAMKINIANGTVPFTECPDIKCRFMSFAADMTPAVSMEMIMIFRERLPGYIKTTKAYTER